MHLLCLHGIYNRVRNKRISKHELQARREAKAEGNVLVWLISQGQVVRPCLLLGLLRNRAGEVGWEHGRKHMESSVHLRHKTVKHTGSGTGHFEA